MDFSQKNISCATLALNEALSVIKGFMCKNTFIKSGL